MLGGVEAGFSGIVKRMDGGWEIVELRKAG